MKSKLATLTLALALATTAVAQQKPIYQPLGAPADPDVPARWNFYRDYAQATGLLKQIAAAHPDICRLESLGKSYGDREMWVMTITNQAQGDEKDEAKKPAFWIDGGIHANEVQAVDVVLYTAWYMTEMYGRNETITRLIDERVFYLMPMMSPDSRDAHMHEPNTTNGPRGGQRPVDDDRDGRVDEDPADDLDGDGHITQMRVRDPLGRYKPHDEYPAMMVRVDPDETGTYTMLGAEGIDNDGDGSVNEDGDGYYDPNRDWPWQWQPAYVQRGAHHYPLSVHENRLVADFVMAHANIAGAQSYHNTGGMILRGPGSKDDRWPRADIAVYDQLGKRGEEMLPGYRYMNTADDLYEVWGGETDWFHTMVGAFAFVNELNTPYNLFRESGETGFFARQDSRHKFDRLLLLGDGFVEWHEVDHPTYGKIEVGGMKKNWGRQPPSFLLEEECHRNMAFTMWHADQMPKVEIDEVVVRSVDDGLFEVTATLMNRKLTPTRSAFNIEHKVTPPDIASIAGERAKVIAAMTSDDRLFDRVQDAGRNPHQVRLDVIPSWRPKYVRWLVAGNGEVEVSVQSTKGGTANTKVPLVDSVDSKED
ncbi:M14 family metallopeptidase [Aeoliella sp.]|uniref:M14 family metallopeptidase n=1 Tax=Aeoliella sp. TaxID=2795800 RepID=UPI003CCBFBC0